MRHHHLRSPRAKGVYLVLMTCLSLCACTLGEEALSEEEALQQIESNYLTGCERAVASPLNCASSITGGVETAQGCAPWAQAQAAGAKTRSRACIDLELDVAQCFANAKEICNTLGNFAPVGECMNEVFELDSNGCR